MNAERSVGQADMTTAISEGELTSEKLWNFLKTKGYLLANSEGVHCPDPGVLGDRLGLLYTKDGLTRFLHAVSYFSPMEMRFGSPLIGELRLYSDSNHEEYEWHIAVFGQRNLERMQELATQTSEKFGKKVCSYLEDPGYRYQCFTEEQS